MRRISLIFSFGFFLLGLVLLVASYLTIGINDGEWRNISDTGLFSTPNALVWTPWHPNDGTVTPFRDYQPNKSPPTLSECRSGRARGFLFDFTVYEGRNNLTAAPIAAIGPDWGASYHYIWAVIALALGTLLIFPSRLSRWGIPKGATVTPARAS